MENHIKPLWNKKIAARFAAIALILMSIIAGITFGVIHTKLIDMTNSELTLTNLKNATSQFNVEIIGWITVLILDLIVSFAFYYYFLSTHSFLSKIGAGLRLIYTLFLSFAIFNLLQITIHLGTISASELLLKLDAFDQFWSRGLIVFGLHLIVIAILMYQTYSVPKLLSLLMLIAGLSYSIIHVLYWLAPSVDLFTKSFENIMVLPMALGELSFAIWLLIRGSRKSLLDTAK